MSQEKGVNKREDGEVGRDWSLQRRRGRERRNIARKEKKAR